MNIHSCGYHCDKPGCIKEQRDDLVKKFIVNAINPLIESNLRKAAQMALEALIGAEDEMDVAMQGAFVALRAALAQPEPEPVAWVGYNLDEMVDAFSRVIEAYHSSKHPFHNPVDMDARTALRILRGFTPAMKAYTASPQRKPLTEDEISEIAMDCSFVSESDTYFARAIERAHGIGGES